MCCAGAGGAVRPAHARSLSGRLLKAWLLADTADIFLHLLLEESHGRGAGVDMGAAVALSAAAA